MNEMPTKQLSRRLPKAMTVRARQARGAAPRSATAHIEVRFLRLTDTERLIKLEQAKWADGQAAGRQEIARRIQAYPHLSIGAFSATTGEALASLFMKPITDGQLEAARTWANCAKVDLAIPSRTRSLFGISLSSVDADAVPAIFDFFWPYSLKAGWRRIYLGSPVPGLRSWLRAHPGMSAESYMREKRNGLPRDPQLRYYYTKGFRHFHSCLPDYFPHEPSLDYGALIHGDIPLSAGAPMWRILPLSWLRGMRKLLFVLVRGAR